jgi:hypothetical protein
MQKQVGPWCRDAEPIFRYTSDKKRWEAEIWPMILMVLGPPPKGIKFYGKSETMHIRSKEAQRYVNKLVAIFKKAVLAEDSSVSHYTTNWKITRAAHMKNLYLRWWYEFSRDN